MIDRWTDFSDHGASAVPVARQTTLRRAVSCDGIGLHSGAPVHLALFPAPANHGIVFSRADLARAQGRPALVPASFDRVVDTRLCTLLASATDPAVRVGTIEHLMAALSACGVDNAFIEVDGPELPILDGSALPFLGLIGQAGLVRQGAPRRRIEILRTVRVENQTGGSDTAGSAELSPGEGFSLDVSIAFSAAAIGRQACTIDRLDQAVFRDQLADCRTFTFADDIARLYASGLARGGSLANAVVVDGATVLNPEGLRRPDEFVRHKALDVVGDLALAGAPLVGRFVGVRPGHALNNQVLRALFADSANWRFADDGTQAAGSGQSVLARRAA